jgi:hypothetical protein
MTDSMTSRMRALASSLSGHSPSLCLSRGDELDVDQLHRALVLRRPEAAVAEQRRAGMRLGELEGALALPTGLVRRGARLVRRAPDHRSGGTCARDRAGLIAGARPNRLYAGQGWRFAAAGGAWGQPSLSSARRTLKQSYVRHGRYLRDVAPCPAHRDDEAQRVELGLVGSTQRRAAHLVRRLHMRLHGIEVADRGVGVILVGLQGFHHGRAR